MNRVQELRRVKSEIETLREEEQRLSTPIAANMGMIRNLYDIFLMTLKRQGDDKPTDSDSRKKFLYAILYIFSPATLVGECMRYRMRESVTDIVGCTPTGVSRDYKTAIFFYSTYTEFRDSVNEIIRDMLAVLGINETI